MPHQTIERARASHSRQHCRGANLSDRLLCGNLANTEKSFDHEQNIHVDAFIVSIPYHSGSDSCSCIFSGLGVRTRSLIALLSTPIVRSRRSPNTNLPNFADRCLVMRPLMDRCCGGTMSLTSGPGLRLRKYHQCICEVWCALLFTWLEAAILRHGKKPYLGRGYPGYPIAIRF